MSGVVLYADNGIPCPFCLAKDSVAAEDLLCAACGERAPVEYLRHQDRLVLTAIQACGWPGHGKSSFLAALTLVLTRMGMVWPGCFYSALTEHSQRKLRELNTCLRIGGLPPATGAAGEAVLLRLEHAGPWGSRLIVYRDGPGEVFDRFEVDVDELPLLHRTPAPFLLLSPNDLQGVAAGRSMEMLMGSLVSALGRAGIDPELGRRCAVVVLTKADAVAGLPAFVRSYLTADRLWTAVSRAGNGAPGTAQSSRSEPLELPGTVAYREQMVGVSEALRAWIENDPAGRNLVRTADDFGIALRFSAVSATGSQAAENGYLTAPWHPRRVIDPLLWALELEPRCRIAPDQGFEPSFGRRGVRLEP
ncbi:MAG: hypothetical protein M3O15_03515 [Acidobacteriota bacterium]|nr:hypothetical protein [Acidobacteriota bacterium]